jgi:DNA primase
LVRSSGVDILSYSIVLPGGYDPDSFIKNFGVEEFQNYVNNASPDTSELIKGLVEEYRTQNKKLTKTGLTQRVIEAVAPYVQEQFTYRSLDLIERLAQELGLNKKSLHDWYAKKESTKSVPRTYQKINEIQFPAPIYERRLLYHLINTPSLWNLVVEEGLNESDFESFLVFRAVNLIKNEMTSIEFLDTIKENLEDEEYHLILSFYSLGIDGDFETALKVLKLKNKQAIVSSTPKIDFLGRPLTFEEKDMKDVFYEKLFEEKDPF